MSQNILERIFEIGTIKIYTNASSNISSRNSQNTMKGKNGIYIHCIKNIQEQYKIIKDIIDEGTLDEY